MSNNTMPENKLSVVLVSIEEDELIACHRLLSPEAQAAIAMIIAANIKTHGLVDRDKVVSIRPHLLKRYG